MSEEQARNGKKPQPNETVSFRFAITLLAALGTVLYAVYNYLRTTPVDPLWYSFGCRLILVAVILGLGLLCYILIKGYLMEAQDSKYLEKLAKYIYIFVFPLSPMLLVFILVFILLSYTLKSEALASQILFLFVLSAVSISIIFSYLLKKKSKKIFQRVVIITEYAFIAFILLSAYLFPLVLYSPLQGHVTVDMEGIYYKNDAPIPVLIYTTGPNTNLSIYLFKEESNHSLYQNDSITLIPEHPSFKTVSGKCLIGNALNYGTYNVFINTTDLSAGYYELHCVRLAYWKTYSARGFYLLNSSEQSCIKG